MKKFWRMFITMALGVSVLGGVACSGNVSMGGARSSAHKIWSPYSTQKIVQNTTYNFEDKDVFNGELSIQMMKDETESGQLIITANSDISSYSLVASDLSDGNGNVIPVSAIEVFHQKYVKIEVKRNKNTDFPVGSYVPDMLLPMSKAIEYSENKVKKNQNQGITVEITTTHDTVPGTYTGNFVLTIDGAPQNIPVTLEVWDIDYEGRNNFMTSFLLYRKQLLYGEYDSSDEMIQSYIDFFLKYKATTYVINASHEPSNDNTLNQVVENFKAESIRQFNLSENMNSIIIPINFDWSYKADTSRQATIVKKYIKALVEISTPDMPLIDYAYFYPSNVDEADNTTGAAGSISSKMQAAINLMKDGGEIQKTLQAVISECQAEGLFDLAQYNDAEFLAHVQETILQIPSVFTNTKFNYNNVLSKVDSAMCPLLHLFGNDIQAGKYLEQAETKANGDLWAYTCTEPLYPNPSFHIDDYSLGARVTGWMEKKFGVNGFLYWSSARNTDGGDRYIDVYETASRYGLNCNGEGFLVYPGRYYGSSSPFPTLRLISHRESVEDYEMLTIYENLLMAYAEKYNVEINFNDYVNDLYDSLFVGAQYNFDDSLVFRAREELARRILALKNDDELIISTAYVGENAVVNVYTNQATVTINGGASTGVISGNGYVHQKVVSSASGETITVTTANGEYTYNPAKRVNVTNFAVNGTDGIVCSGRVATGGESSGELDKINSTKSTITANGDKADVLIRSYYANGEGYGGLVGVGGIDAATRRINLGLTIPFNNFADTTAVYFTTKNTSVASPNKDEAIPALEIELYATLSNGQEVYLGCGYCGLNRTTNIRISIQNPGVDLSLVTNLKLRFANTYVDEGGYRNLWIDRTFELSDIWVEKN